MFLFVLGFGRPVLVVRSVSLVALLVSATATLIACSGPATPTSSSDQDLVQSGGKGGSSKGGEESADGGKAPANDTGKGDGGGTGSTGTPPGKGGGKGEPTEPEQPADPDCIANCNANLKAKCDGDDEFCSDMCNYMEPAQLACVIAAPSCEKTEWIRCAEENPGDPGAGTKGTGGK